MEEIACQAAALADIPDRSNSSLEPFPHTDKLSSMCNHSDYRTNADINTIKFNAADTRKTKLKTNSFKLGYRPELDGLRAIAIISVLLIHAALIGKGSDFSGLGGNLPLLSGGVFGVDIFFVLSGFLISTLLIQELKSTGTISFKAFYFRRVLRLLPAMVLLLAACSIYVVFFKPIGNHFGYFDISMAALYISNMAVILTGHDTGMLTHTWSLSIEEQFYAVWPLFLLFLLKFNKAKITKISIALIIFAWLLRSVFYWGSVKTGSAMMANFANGFLLTRADGLISGALAAMFVNWRQVTSEADAKIWKIIGYVSFVLLIYKLAFSPSWGPNVFFVAYLIVSILAALLVTSIAIAPSGKLNALLRLKPLVWVGKISYGLYLFHVPVISLMPMRVSSSFLTFPRFIVFQEVGFMLPVFPFAER